MIVVNLDHKQTGFPEHVLPAHLTKLGVKLHIENQDTYSIVKRVMPKAGPCAACTRGCAGAFCTG